MAESLGFEEDTTRWPLRPAVLALIGTLAALAVHHVSGGAWVVLSAISPAAWRIALSTAITAGALSFGFALERRRWWWTVAFGLAVGAIAGLIVYWNGAGAGAWHAWRSASLYLAIAIAVPLFQTVRDQGAWRFPYADIHGDAWTNVVLWGACWLFTGVTFALVWLLASLFDLIGLHVLRDLLRHGWFGAMLFGSSFGGSLGLLRERDGVLRLLQRVVTAVLGVLAPVLGAGLLVFLLSLPFTGLHALWEATKSTTPILLSCVIGALILANAVIGNGEGDEATNPVLRFGAIALALAVLPLAGIAAIATGLRIGQYGLTPERLWAVVFVALACVYGVAYLVAVLRGRAAWGVYARPSNVRLAFLVAGVGLVLATPITSFNALSVADQVARLESGRVAPAKFDWAALAFDLGDPGKAALHRLTQSKTPAIAARAREIATKTNRWEVASVDRTQSEADLLVKRLRVLPAAVPVPLALRSVLTGWQGCRTDRENGCTLLYTPGASEAVSLAQSCIDELTREPRSAGASVMPTVVLRSGCGVSRYQRTGESWARIDENAHATLTPAERAALKAGAADGKVEIRAVPARRVFVGGVPVGDPFE
jgi:multisubunit Na+/H+ antiporter MnhG subunit